MPPNVITLHSISQLKCAHQAMKHMQDELVFYCQILMSQLPGTSSYGGNDLF